MIKGKSLVLGVLISAALLFAGGSQAFAGQKGSSDQTLKERVEKALAKTTNSGGLPVTSTTCRRFPSKDWDAGLGMLKAFKCKTEFQFGSDRWQWVWWLPSRNSLSVMASIWTPWYNGEWYVDCRTTESKGFCLKLGKQQMDACMDRPTDRAYCWAVVYGGVDLEEAERPRYWGPAITSPNPRGLDESQLVKARYPNGRTVWCGREPLKVDPALSPTIRGVSLAVRSEGRTRTVKPELDARCAYGKNRGKVAWYLPEEDPNRFRTFPGKPIELEIPLPAVTSSATELGRFVNSGGCVEKDGIVPPCAPDSPRELRTPWFSTSTDSRPRLSGYVEVTGEGVPGAIGGEAQVTVRLKLGSVIAEEVTVDVAAGDRLKIPIEAEFFLAEGVHRLSMEVSGSGFDGVNVSGRSAKLKTVIARTFSLPDRSGPGRN